MYFFPQHDTPAKKILALCRCSATLELSSKGLGNRIDKLTQRSYDTIQGLLSYVVLISLAIAVTFTVDYTQLLGANDTTAWAREFMPPFIITTWAIFAIAVVAKLWGAWVQYRFWYRIDLSNKLHALAEKIDPRRK